jgi:hypothetical protein
MRMLKTHILLIAVILASLCAGCVASTGSAPSISISADRQEYSPIMSSTVGIGLTPVLSSGINNSSVSLHWSTDYGYFNSWGTPDFTVNDLGPDTLGDHKIYWSYNASDMGKEKPPVHITLSLIDRDTGDVINTTSLEIGWKDNDMAVVEK